MNILSTKILSEAQKKKFLEGNISYSEYDAISVAAIKFEAPSKILNAIFTSKNAVNAVFKENKHLIQNCFCVGALNEQLLIKNGQNVIKSAENASYLADYIVKNHQNEVFYFFCGNLRRDEIPSALKEAKIDHFEVKTYETTLNLKNIEEFFDGILFFSPSGVQSFANHNDFGNTAAFCIGETTASEAKKHTNNIIIAENTSIESTIDIAIKTILNND